MGLIMNCDGSVLKFELKLVEQSYLGMKQMIAILTDRFTSETE